MTPTHPVSDATEAYQAMLEGVRAHPDDEQLREDFEKAKAEMERAWLAKVTALTGCTYTGPFHDYNCPDCPR